MTTFIFYVRQRASCQPQCPPSRFHCPLCDHTGALPHFSTLSESTEPRTHCEEQHKVEATLSLRCVFYGEYAYRHSILGLVLCRKNVVLWLWEIFFTSSTTFWPVEGSTSERPWVSVWGWKRWKKFHPDMKVFIVLLGFQLHHSATAQIVKKNMYSNVWKKIHCV